MRHIQIFKQLSKLGRYPRRGDRGTVRLRYNKVVVIVRFPVLFCLFALCFLHGKLFEEKRAGNTVIYWSIIMLALCIGLYMVFCKETKGVNLEEIK